MHKLTLAACLVVLSFATAQAAPTYAWCQRTKVTGGNPECSFTSLNQCRASVSGVGGDCIRNPSFAYGLYQDGKRMGCRSRSPAW